MSLGKFRRNSDIGKPYPVSIIRYNGDSPYFRPGYAQFHLKVTHKKGKECWIHFFVPFKIEQAQSTQLTKIKENGRVHFILGIDPNALQRIKDEVRDERNVRVWPREKIFRGMDHRLID